MLYVHTHTHTHTNTQGNKQKCKNQETQIPIITVDNTCHMNGHPYDGPTSSESGVTVDGKWVTKVPRLGTQHFYYDF